MKVKKIVPSWFMIKLCTCIMIRIFIFVFVILCVSACSDEYSNEREFPQKPLSILKSDTIDFCVSDFSVGFSLFRHKACSYVAYYDTNHVMTVASKGDGETKWKYHKINEKVGHDSHNYVTLVLDEKGYIHLSGNMHAVPMKYFRSVVPYDIESLKTEVMVGDVAEQKVTYPIFLKSPENLIFHFRDGRSGSGVEVFNIYNPNTKQWRRMMDEPLLDGAGQSNAYIIGPEIGPDGKYHMMWMWRDTPDCISNHGVYYAYSDDLLAWKSIYGDEKTVPITLADEEFIVDDVKVNGGLINMGFSMGFAEDDASPLLVWHKYDDLGKTNIFVATSNEGSWRIQQVTHWNWRWEFSGT